MLYYLIPIGITAIAFLFFRKKTHKPEKIPAPDNLYINDAVLVRLLGGKKLLKGKIK